MIAHRGASYWAPEATLPAYLLAREMGVDYLEGDLQRTKDGVIVVFHDDTLADKTNVAHVFPGRENDPIETFTYEELMQLDAGSWFNEAFPDRARPSFAGQRILTLEELIDVAKAVEGGPGLYLETKSAHRHAGYEEEIVRILREAGYIAAPGATPGRRFVRRFRAADVPSFVPESLVELKRLAPDVPRVLLVSTEIEAERRMGSIAGVRGRGSLRRGTHRVSGLAVERGRSAPGRPHRPPVHHQFGLADEAVGLFRSGRGFYRCARLGAGAVRPPA